MTITGDFFGDHPILNVSDFVVIPKKRSYASYEDIDGKRIIVMGMKHDDK